MGSSSINDAAIAKEKTDQEIDAVEKKPTIVFVLGGPGGGKSTQCANISKYIGFTHLSSGEELRKAGDSDPDNGEMIKSMLKDGLSVPPDITLRVLQEAMKKSGNDKFLLDGFPRDEEIRAAFEDALNIEPELVVFFHCSAEERKKRILSRNQGRVDDNVESVSKRFTYFDEYTLPVVEYYRSRGKVYEIDASKPMDEVFDTLKTCLTPLSPRIETEVVSEAKTEAEGEMVGVVAAEAASEVEEDELVGVVAAEAASEVEVEVQAVGEGEGEGEGLEKDISKLGL